jgi:hypothetical protein
MKWVQLGVIKFLEGWCGLESGLFILTLGWSEFHLFQILGSKFQIDFNFCRPSTTTLSIPDQPNSNIQIIVEIRKFQHRKKFMKIFFIYLFIYLFDLKVYIKHNKSSLYLGAKVLQIFSWYGTDFPLKL